MICVVLRLWDPPESDGLLASRRRREQELQIVSEDCNTEKKVRVCVGFRSFCIWIQFGLASLVFRFTYYGLLVLCGINDFQIL